jgi:hypothetical protein
MYDHTNQWIIEDLKQKEKQRMTKTGKWMSHKINALEVNDRQWPWSKIGSHEEWRSMQGTIAPGWWQSKVVLMKEQATISPLMLQCVDFLRFGNTAIVIHHIVYDDQSSSALEWHIFNVSHGCLRNQFIQLLHLNGNNGLFCFMGSGGDWLRVFTLCNFNTIKTVSSLIENSCQCVSHGRVNRHQPVWGTATKVLASWRDILGEIVFFILLMFVLAHLNIFPSNYVIFRVCCFLMIKELAQLFFLCYCFSVRPILPVFAF